MFCYDCVFTCHCLCVCSYVSMAQGVLWLSNLSSKYAGMCACVRACVRASLGSPTRWCSYASGLSAHLVILPCLNRTVHQPNPDSKVLLGFKWPLH